ncbi:unnamed protein product [Symbiodinium microadriaticum]|nr:unnamed protein product [Symbiodinium microadriaticum]
MSDWFSAHKDGLRQVSERIVERRGFGIIGGELYQNVMDTDATKCVITIEKLPNKPQARLICEDDGHGFHDLTHAWTMFAPSEKKGDPTKAGRFNVGEKMVLSFCREASIATTTGTVVFDGGGRKNYPRRKRDNGTVFEAVIDCTQERYEQFIEYMQRILVHPDRNITLTVNGEQIGVRVPIHTFECTLPTEIGDDLRPSQRKCEVQVFEPLPDETPSLYELGIPVVETADKWHINVMQKVPLNVDRDNVTPSYLRKVRVAVINEMHEKLTEDDTTEAWVNEATSDENCSDDAAETFRVKRYGKKSLAFDPSDPEANKRATAAGYTVIPSRGLTKGQRDNLKRAGTLSTSGYAFPTPKPYSDNPDAPPVKVLEWDKLTDGMKKVYEYVCAVGVKLTDLSQVRFVHTTNHFAACCGPDGVLDFNVFRLGRKWFDGDDDNFWIKVDRLMIHELAHVKEPDHLSDEFHEECCRLGAKLVTLALNEPELLRKHRRTNMIAQAKTELTVLSFGAGQDSTAILYMLAYDKKFRRKYAPGRLVVLFSDTGDEHPMTYLHLISVERFCEENDIEFYQITPDMGFHSDKWRTLRHQWEINHTVGMKVGFKSCTDNLKIKPLYRFLNRWIAREYGLPWYGTPWKNYFALVKFAGEYGKVDVMIGIAREEEGRVASADAFKGSKWMMRSVNRVYPLIDVGMNRADCQQKIRDYGEVVPPPSNCMLCPFMNLVELLWLHRHYPKDFEAWCRFEDRKQEKFKHLGEKNMGVFGKKTLRESLATAEKKHGHMTNDQLEEYKMSHGHCVKSKY